MVVLVVDDQISVVSAIISGIRWSDIGVETVLKAYNAYEAKTVLRTRPVDIMLCDIEMPAEDGLSLFRWTKENKYEPECIFLTAHADFIYAKEALRLGSFDYILQPARYEDVQSALQKAILRVKSKKEHQQYYAYGKLWMEDKNLLIDSVLKKWLTGDKIDTALLSDDLRKLRIELEEGDMFYCSLIQILGWGTESRDDRQNDELFRYGITNVLGEMLGYYGQKGLLVKNDENSYFLLNYGTNSPLQEESMLRIQEEFMNVCTAYYHCRFAVYAGPPIHLGDLAAHVSSLLRLCENNVARMSRVIGLNEAIEGGSDYWQGFNRNRWSTLMTSGQGETAKLEIIGYLDALADKKILNAGSLQRFYQEFMRLLFKTLEAMNLSMSDVFPNLASMEQFMHAYRSIDDTKRMVDSLISGLNAASGLQLKTENQMDKIIRYIHDNLEKDIHRSELAAAVYLSPDYISHLFSRKMNMTLSEFVAREKMAAAQALLRTTSLPISVVAAKVGYSNFSYFSKTYKRIFGITPAADRRKDN